MKKYLPLAEKIFTVISLIHYSGGPLVVILSGGVSEGDSIEVSSDFAVIQLIFLVNYLITLCLLILRWKKVIQIITKDVWIWLLLGLAVFSVFWSDVPDLTRSRIIALIGTTLFSLYIASRYSLKEQLELLGWTFGIIIISSILFAVGLPAFGRMTGTHFGAWRGIYNHKNVLGKIMSLSAVVFLLLGMRAQKRHWIFWIGFIFSIFLIIASKASSPLISVIILVISLFLLRILRWRYDLMIPTVMGIVTITIITYIFLIFNAESIAALFGKDLTLTGRTNFWPLLIEKIDQRPWLGYGFSGFWAGLQGESSDIWYALDWKPPNSHNGFLDLCLDLGLVGLSIHLIELVTSFFMSMSYIRLVKTSDAFLPALYLIFIVLSNLTESTLMIQNNFFWTMQVAIFFSIRSQYQREKAFLLSNNIPKFIRTKNNFSKKSHKYLN